VFTYADTIVKRLLIFVAALALCACNLDVPAPEGSTSGPSDPSTETFAAGLQIDLSKMTKTVTGTYYRDAKVGTGAEIAGATTGVIIYRFAAFLKDGRAFDQQAVSTTVAFANLIGGLRDAMRGMKVGGERIFVIPSELAFGITGIPGLGIPPNATVIYDVILDGIP